MSSPSPLGHGPLSVRIEGPPGAGKTVLSLWLIRRLRELGHNVPLTEDENRYLKAGSPIDIQPDVIPKLISVETINRPAVPAGSPTSLILDFETLDTRPDAVVIEMGCLAVNRTDFVPVAELSLQPAFLPQFASGRSWSTGTIEWQRKKGTFPQKDGFHSLDFCTKSLAAFIEVHKPHRIWAWGKDFERPLLENLCHASGIRLPEYQFRGFACGRDIWQHAFGLDHRPPERTHRALSDCLDELRDIRSALEELNLTHVF